MWSISPDLTMNIIEFADQHAYPLTPVQRVVLKLYYGLPLSKEPANIPGESEAGYLYGYLTPEKRVSFDRYRLERAPSYPTTFLLCMGRRSGKDHLALLVLMYEVWRLAKKTTSESYLGEARPLISLYVLAPSQDLANLLSRTLLQAVAKFPEVQERQAHVNRDFVSFQTDADIEEDQPWEGSRRQARATLRIVSRGSRSRSYRGIDPKIAILNEFGLFPEGSARDALALLGSSMESYGNRGNRMLILGTPSSHGQPTVFRRRVKEALSNNRQERGHPPRVIAVRIPTWDARPDLDLSGFQERLGPVQFAAEFGAEFLTQPDLFLPDSMLDALAEKVGSPLSVSNYLYRLIEEDLGPTGVKRP